MTPLKVSRAGKSRSKSRLPKADDNTGADSIVLTRVVPLHSRESDADAILEVAGLVSVVPSKVEVDVTVGLAGLASAGEERAVLQSLLAMDTALLSITVSPVKSGLVVVGNCGVKEGMETGEAEEGTSSKLPSTAWLSSMDESLEFDADITNGSDHQTAFETYTKNNEIIRFETIQYILELQHALNRFSLNR